MKAVFDEEIHYYKYVYEDWTQPTLTSNGTMGGDTMAVSLNWSGYNYNYGTAYQIFSPNTGNAGFYADEWKSSMYVVFYLPKHTRLTSFTFSAIGTGDGADGAAYNTRLYGGNFINDRREQLYYMGDTWGGTYTITSQNYYQYFVLYLENGGGAYEDKVTIAGLSCAGVSRTVTDGTESDYDYKIETGDTYLLKRTENNIDKYYALKSWEKGQYYGN